MEKAKSQPMNSKNPLAESSESPRRHDCILFFLQAPAIKSAWDGGLDIARTLQDGLERILESKGLLFRTPPISAFAPAVFASLKTMLDNTAKEGNAALEKMEQYSTLTEAQKEAYRAIHKKLLASGESILSARPPSVLPTDEGLTGWFYVTDAMRALLIVETELKRAGLLERAKIGYWDCVNETVYSHFPRNAIGHVEQHLLALFKKYGILPPSTQTPQ